MHLVLQSHAYFLFGLQIALALAALVGALFAARIRSDAYPAADRHPKAVWVSILLVTGIVIGATQVMLFSFIGSIIIGLFWFDIYPQLRDLVEGRYNW